MQLNPRWVGKVSDEIATGQFDFVQSSSMAKQHIVKTLTLQGKQFVAINCGAGVMRITNKPELMKCCPKCGGKGVVA